MCSIANPSGDPPALLGGQKKFDGSGSINGIRTTVLGTEFLIGLRPKELQSASESLSGITNTWESSGDAKSDCDPDRDSDTDPDEGIQAALSGLNESLRLCRRILAELTGISLVRDLSPIGTRFPLDDAQ